MDDRSQPTVTTRADQSSGSAVEHVPARAALAGNPSDGFGGAVLALPVEACRATISVRPSDAWTMGDEVSGRRVFADLDAVIEAADAARADSSHALLLASIAAFTAITGRRPAPRSVDVTTTIPLSVGLAGSSAIVVGVLRAMFGSAEIDLPRELRLAQRALEVETDRLGITAGLQDRIVQAFGRPVLMRFDRVDEPRSTALSATPVDPGAAFRLLVAHRAGFSEPSQVVHGDLRQRFEAGDDRVVESMDRLRTQAITAGAAFESGDTLGLGRAMDVTYDLRSQMLDLVPGHVEMVTAARSVGASANYTGSGGAIIVLSPDAATEVAVRQSLKRLGCEIVEVSLPVETTTWLPASLSDDAVAYTSSASSD